RRRGTHGTADADASACVARSEFAGIDPRVSADRAHGASGVSLARADRLDDVCEPRRDRIVEDRSAALSSARVGGAQSVAAAVEARVIDASDWRRLRDRLASGDARATHKIPGSSGIVMAAGGLVLTANAWLAVERLRAVGCGLPIELFHFAHETIPSRVR